MKPAPPSILDPRFVYVPSCQTNLRERFRQIDPAWCERPQHWPSQQSERDRINGWAREGKP